MTARDFGIMVASLVTLAGERRAPELLCDAPTVSSSARCWVE
ncbi:hypothetical protein [Amycolatopsis orientalis]|nr:hypothetical protein [Amycolatopsis orientalis]